jgi:O-antigen ligase
MLKASVLSSVALTFAALARSLLVGAIVYGAWRYGATQLVTIQHIAVTLVVTCVLLALAALSGWKASLPPVVPTLLLFCWLSYSCLQSGPVPQWMAPWFYSVQSLRAEYAIQPANQLIEIAANVAGNPVRPLEAPIQGTIAQEYTREAILPYALCLVVFLLSCVLFQTERSRRMLLWVVLVHCVLLVAWGIIQRANGNHQILPGVMGGDKGVPFASFVYKNAGATAVLPGVGAALSLLLWGKRKSTPPRYDHMKTFYAREQWFPTPRDLSLIFMLGVLCAGVLASLSRGAWISGLIGLIAFVLYGGWAVFTRRTLSVLIVLVAVSGLVGTLVIGDIQTRVSQVSADNIRMDQRWSNWVDGFKTAKQHFPSGSGLGTYGYATLPNQFVPKSSWFREAHNHYLEVAAESGLIGLTILVAALIWFLRSFLNAIFKYRKTEGRILAAFGLFVLLCGALQSIGDFVLTIPANMLFYALIMGVCSVATRSPQSSTGDYSAIRMSTSSRPSSLNSISLWERMAFGSLLAAMFCLALCAYQLAAKERAAQTQIELLSADHLTVLPTRSFVKDKLDAIDQTIEILPANSHAFRRRALWRFAIYRLDIIERAKSQGESITWEMTSPERLYLAIFMMPDEARVAVRQELLASPLERGRLGSIYQDLASALVANPCFTQVHLAAAMIAPISGHDPRSSLMKAARLSNCDAEKLFFNGLAAYQCGAVELMTDQWSRNLSLNHNHLDTILSLSLEKLPAHVVAKKLIPRARADLFVRLVKNPTDPLGGTSTGTPRSEQTFPQAELTDKVLHIVLNDPAILDSRRHSVAAQLYELKGDGPSSIKHWLLAVQAEPRNTVFRLNVATALIGQQQFDEAIRHAVLGQALDPSDSRFNSVLGQIRQEIATQRR